MKIIVAPDKFKGSLTAMEVCLAVQKGIFEVDSSAEVKLIPLADGGEGSMDVLIDILKLRPVEVTVRDPLFRTITSTYAVSAKDAYIELARASGLQLLRAEERNATKTSTIGVGDLMQHALENGAKNIYLLVGGSATNDGGMGLAHGLGFRFCDELEEELSPIGENLWKVRKIEGDLRWSFNLTIVTDVQNALLGPEGASQLYGPQKGADPKEVQILEEGLRHFSKLIKERSGIKVSEMPGSGAAGGIAVCGSGLLGGEIAGGIDTFLKVTNFQEFLSGADLVITGEGKLDIQTLQGKVVNGVSRLAREVDVPLVVVCGDSELTPDQLDHFGAVNVLKIKTEELSVDYCMKHGAELITHRVAAFLTGYLAQ